MEVPNSTESFIATKLHRPCLIKSLGVVAEGAQLTLKRMKNFSQNSIEA